MKLLLALAMFAAVGHAQTQSDIYKPGKDVSLPRAIKQVKADYTNEAKDQRIEGSVVMDVVVLADGSVGDVKVARSLDSVYGLDASAVKAMKQWQFEPGKKDGRAVAVAVNVEMTFSLK